jgi:predicted RNA polymerase sigma factor
MDQGERSGRPVSVQQLGLRLPAVQSILYLLFTEGYLSSHADGAIRRELCDEAKRLAHVLAEHSVSATPGTFALLALMHLHDARMPARQDGSGGLLLLEEQDRTLWDAREIQIGLSWLAKSAEGDVFSRYHAEAGIAAEHALGSDRRVLRASGAARALCASHPESRDRDCGTPRTR